MNRVLVTGASGFVGFHVLPILEARGFEVHAVSRRPSAGSSTLRWHEVDLLEEGGAVRLISELRPSHLLHLAWYAEPGKYWSDPVNTLWVDATLKLVRTFREHGGRRAVLAGSCAEYDWNSGPCREHVTPLKPTSVYGKCKHASQLLLDAFSQATGLSSAWGRIFYLYGPRERPERLVPTVVRSLLSGKPAPCTAGVQARDFLHVQDAASAFAAVLESDYRGPINIASGAPVMVKDLVTEIARQLGRPELLKLGALAMPEDEPQSVSGDSGLLARLGWAPQHDLPGGIRHTIAWWRGQLENKE